MKTVHSVYLFTMGIVCTWRCCTSILSALTVPQSHSPSLYQGGNIRFSIRHLIKPKLSKLLDETWYMAYRSQHPRKSSQRSTGNLNLIHVLATSSPNYCLSLDPWEFSNLVYLGSKHVHISPDLSIAISHKLLISCCPNNRSHVITSKNTYQTTSLFITRKPFWSM